MTHKMTVLHEKGDHILEWETPNSAKAKEAEKEFNKCIKAGYRAFGKKGKGKKRMEEFSAHIKGVYVYKIPTSEPINKKTFFITYKVQKVFRFLDIYIRY